MSLRFLRLSVVALALVPAALLAQAPTPLPQAPTVTNPFGIPNPNEMVSRLALPDTDIDTFINTLEEYTGRTVLRPATLPVPNNTFNLVLNRPTSRADIVRFMETILQLNGLSVIYQDDKALKLVPNTLARGEAPRIITGSTLDLAPSGLPASKIFVLDFVNATQLQATVTPLLSTGVSGFGGSGVLVLASANAIMVTDTLTNLQRIEAFLRTVDRPVGENLQVKLYPLKNARATDMVTRIRGSFSGASLTQLTGTTTFSADDRTNQVIITADPRQMALFDSLIEKLDTPAVANTTTKVINIKHATAANVAQIINAVISGQTTAAQRANPANAAGRGGQAGANQQGGQGGAPANPGAGPGVVPAAPAAPGAPGAAVPAAAVAPAAAAPAGAAGGGAGGGGASPVSNEFSPFVTVTQDPRTNSIVVNGTANDIKLIEVVVEGVDILLDQVVIEVVIAEITLTDSDISGLSALNLAIGTDTPGGTVTRDPLTGAAATIGSTDGRRGTHITNYAGTLGGWAISGGQVNPLAFAASMNSAGARSNVRVLQSNTLLTTHATEATFEATQNQPIVTGSQTDANGGVTSQTSFEPIGVTMNVTPLIGKDGSIQLEIEQVVDDIASFVTIDNNPTPVISHRRAQSFVNVRDREMIVLGGLQSNRRSNSREKIGFIWEIPLLSNLLGGRNRTNDRTELLFFIRPRIVKVGEASEYTRSKINELSNRKEVDQYLVDPAKPLPNSVLELIK